MSGRLPQILGTWTLPGPSPCPNGRAASRVPDFRCAISPFKSGPSFRRSIFVKRSCCRISIRWRRASSGTQFAGLTGSASRTTRFGAHHNHALNWIIIGHIAHASLRWTGCLPHALPQTGLQRCDVKSQVGWNGSGRSREQGAARRTQTARRWRATSLCHSRHIGPRGPRGPRGPVSLPRFKRVQ